MKSFRKWIIDSIKEDFREIREPMLQEDKGMLEVFVGLATAIFPSVLLTPFLVMNFGYYGFLSLIAVTIGVVLAIHGHYLVSES